MMVSTGKRRLPMEFVIGNLVSAKPEFKISRMLYEWGANRFSVIFFDDKLELLMKLKIALA
jgi:hypothetical protein